MHRLQAACKGFLWAAVRGSCCSGVLCRCVTAFLPCVLPPHSPCEAAGLGWLLLSCSLVSLLSCSLVPSSPWTLLSPASAEGPCPERGGGVVPLGWAVIPQPHIWNGATAKGARGSRLTLLLQPEQLPVLMLELWLLLPCLLLCSSLTGCQKCLELLSCSWAAVLPHPCGYTTWSSCPLRQCLAGGCSQRVLLQHVWGWETAWGCSRGWWRARCDG